MSAMGADVHSQPGQRRSSGKETKEQQWRTCDDATEKLNHRDKTRAGVTNLFTVKAETTAVELTECRSTEEGLTGTTSNMLRSECLDPDQGSAVNEGTCGISTTDDSSEFRGERRRKASDGNDAVRENGDTEFTSWTPATESTWDELYTDRTTPTSADEERRANDDDQQRLSHGVRSDSESSDRPNRRGCWNISTAWREPSSRWGRGRRSVDGKSSRICFPTAHRADDAGGPLQDTTFAAPTTRS